MKEWMIAVAAIALGLAGCDRSEPKTEVAPQAALPAGLIVSAAPQDAKDVKALRQSAKQGDAVVLRGKIAGRKDPLAEGRAVMNVLDLSVATCENMPGDGCPTPWDACCEPKTDVAAGSATVQVNGTDGKPLKLSLNGAGGIAPGKQIVVAGTVSSASDAPILVVDAKQIYVTP